MTAAARAAVMIGAGIAATAAGCGGGGDDAATPDAPATAPDARAVDADPTPIAPAAVVIGGAGEGAVIDLEAPWAVRATFAIGHPAGAIRYHDRHLYAVGQDEVVAIDLRDQTTRAYPFAGDDPRDIAFVDADTAVVSVRARPVVVVLALATGDRREIDLTSLADPAEGLAAGMLASCDRRVFVQLQRPTTPGIGVVDVTTTGGAAVQTVATEHPPAFVMPTDCPDRLYVAEPVPLMLGGGSRQTIALATLTAAPLPLGDGLGEVGGFVMLDRQTAWAIHHTEFGPAPSSHLGLLPDHGGVWDTFADLQVDHLALDVPTGQVWFPDACTTDCLPDHATGVQVFDATTAARLTTAAIDVGFPPVDVVIAR